MLNNDVLHKLKTIEATLKRVEQAAIKMEAMLDAANKPTEKPKTPAKKKTTKKNAEARQ